MKRLVDILILVLIVSAIVCKVMIPPLGTILLYLAVPTLVVYSLIVFRRQTVVPSPLRNTLVSAASLNAALIVLLIWTRLIHSPLYVLLLGLSALTTAGALIVGGIYFYKNRKTLAHGVRYEILVLFFPAIIFTWYFIPSHKGYVGIDEYAENMTEATIQFENAQRQLIKEKGSCQEVDYIEEVREQVISITGGEDGASRMMGFRSDLGFVKLDNEEDSLKSILTPTQFEELKQSRFSGELNFKLAKYQLEILQSKNGIIEE